MFSPIKRIIIRQNPILDAALFPQMKHTSKYFQNLKSMIVIPFLLTSHVLKVEPRSICLQRQKGEAMPLFPIPPPWQIRIPIMTISLNKSLISLDRSQSRNNAIFRFTVGTSIYIELDTITARSLVQDYRKIYAFAMAKLCFIMLKNLLKPNWTYPYNIWRQNADEIRSSLN